jgi:dihydrofolate synthase / folylpolyglutamate synthase
LRGINQLLNASAVLAALEALRERLPVSAQDIRSGLLSVELPGRFQVLPGRPAIILDVAHNPHAAAALAQNLKRTGYYRYTYAVFGAMRDKDINGIFKYLLASVDHWYLTDLPVPRAASAAEIEMHARAAGFRAHKDARLSCFAMPAQAYAAACADAGENDRIIVFGSFHTVGSVMAWRA